MACKLNPQNYQSRPYSRNKFFYIWRTLFYNWQLYIQWRSEIQTSLDFDWSKRGWVVNSPDFVWDLKYRQITAILSKKNIWNLDKKFWILNGWDYSYSQSSSSTIWNPTFKTPDFKWSDFRSPLYSTRPTLPYLSCYPPVCSRSNKGREYKHLIQVRGSHSHQVRPQFRGSKGEDTHNKGKGSKNKIKTRFKY